MKIMLASRNQGKIRELSKILEPLNIELASQLDSDIESPDETGITFVENALIKAREVSKKAGLPCIADDSGICVPALGGAPGIYSARYAGVGASDEQNNEKLRQKLSKETDTHAFYYCVLVFVRNPLDPAPIISVGEWHGSIVQEKKGSNGFGYDPYFWLQKYQCTAAELPSHTKNLISHRAKASRKLMEELIQVGI